MPQSTGCLSTVTKVIAAFLALFVVITLPITLLVYDFSRVLFSPEVMSDVLTTRLIDSGVFQGAVTDVLLSPETLDNLGQGDADLGRYFKDLTPAERETMLEIILPSEWIENQISTVLRELSLWIDNDQPLPQLFLDMRPIKARLMRGGAEEIVDMVVDSWPSCTPEQVERISESGLAGQTPLIQCEPPEPFRTRLVVFASTQLIEMIRQIPPDFPLTGDEIGGQEIADITEAKRNVRSIRALTRSGWLLPIALLCLIIALVVRSWRDLSRWWGIPLTLCGVITLGLVVFTSAISEDFIEGILADLRWKREVLYNLSLIVARGFMESALGSLFFHALLVGGIGVILLVVGWFIGRRTSSVPLKQQVPVQQTKAAISSPDSQQYSSSVPPPPPVSPIPQDEPASEDEPDRPTGVFG